MSGVRILACQPADQAERDALARATGRPLPEYTGSRPGRCDYCGREVLLGPRQQGLLSGDGITVACFFCAAAARPAPDRVISLGNPEGRVR